MKRAMEHSVERKHFLWVKLEATIFKAKFHMYAVMMWLEPSNVYQLKTNSRLCVVYKM